MKTLAVLFTEGESLANWERHGILERELKIFRALLPYFRGVAFFTYGDRREFRYQSLLGDIEILPNRWRFRNNVFSCLGLFLYFGRMRRIACLRTIQNKNTYHGIIGKLLLRKRLVVRAGYLWSAFLEKNEPRSWTRFWAQKREVLAWRLADRIMVTTDAARNQVLRYGVSPQHVTVIPNYVDTECFRPDRTAEKEKGRICYAGRLEKEKNLFALLDAVRQVPQLHLQLMGTGSLERALKEKASREHIRVEFSGVIPHHRLPAELNRAEIFALPSFSEGHPKALLEAMACGLCVVGTDVPGIRNLVIDGKTGFLCGTAAGEIAACLKRIVADEKMRANVAEAGRRFCLENFSFEKILRQELAVYRSLRLTPQYTPAVELPRC